MALFKDRQDYLETRKMFHDADMQNELSKWGRKRRRNKDYRDQRHLTKMVTGSGADFSKLAASQSLSMRILQGKM